MSNYVVTYESENGKTEVFGLFNSEETAREWMKQDVEQSIEMLKENACEVHLEEEDFSIKLDNCGRWEIIDVTEVASE